MLTTEFLSAVAACIFIGHVTHLLVLFSSVILPVLFFKLLICAVQ